MLVNVNKMPPKRRHLSIYRVKLYFHPTVGLCVSAFAPGLLLPLLIGCCYGEITIPENLACGMRIKIHPYK